MALSTFLGHDPMLSQIDRAFDRAFSRWGFPTTLDLAIPTAGTNELFKHLGGTHPMDIVETEKAFELRCDAPGMSPEDIKVEVQDGVLNVSGAHSSHKKQKDKAGKAIRSERTFTSFSRSFTLPDTAKEDEITASLDKGVLMVSLPKKEAAPKPEPKRVKVHAKV